MVRTWTVGVGLCVVCAYAAPLAAQGRSEGPTLVVAIVVDQLRGDLIDRYAPAFDGGFRRFLEEGFRYTAASHAHANTETAAGHATLATGVHPARSGIVANDWDRWDGGAWREGTYAVEDPEAPIVGFPDEPGRSPRNLLSDGLADWILAADPRARIVSLSAKDRAAIPLAGRTKGEVYWLLHAAGRFVTSAYYRDGYPDWVERFNESVMPALLADAAWSSVVPPEHRGLARVDEGTPFEGDGAHTTFPHRADEETDAGDPAAFNEWALRQPRVDRAVLSLARVAVEELRLGRRGTVDYLAISLSATDYIGHDYGPLSQEQLDNLGRLDRELGDFLTFLDDRVGRGRWVAGLSADHGVLTMPDALAAEGRPGRRTEPRLVRQQVARAVEDAEREVDGDQGPIAERLARLLEERGIALAAYTHAALEAGPPADSFAVLARNSLHAGRAAGRVSRHGVEVRHGYAELVRGPRGTTHGTPYWYDRWVPLVFLGPGAGTGESAEAAHTIDFAPTLARLAGVPVPDDLDGRALRP